MFGHNRAGDATRRVPAAVGTDRAWPERPCAASSSHTPDLPARRGTASNRDPPMNPCPFLPGTPARSSRDAAAPVLARTR